MILSRFNPKLQIAYSILGWMLLCLFFGSTVTGQANTAKFRLSTQSQNRSASTSYSRSASSLRSGQSISGTQASAIPKPFQISDSDFLSPVRSTTDDLQAADPPQNQNTQQGFRHFRASSSLTTTDIQQMINQTELELRVMQSRQEFHQSDDSHPQERAASQVRQTTFVDQADSNPSNSPFNSAWDFEAPRIEDDATRIDELSNNQSKSTVQSKSAIAKPGPKPAAANETNTGTGQIDTLPTEADSNTPPVELSHSKSKNKPTTLSEISKQESDPEVSDRKPFNLNQTIKTVSFATFAVLLVCVIAIFALKKLGVHGNRLGQTNQKEVTVVNRTSLTSKCEVHLVQFKNHKIVVGVDQTGIKSMLCLPSSFTEELDGASDGSRTI